MPETNPLSGWVKLFHTSGAAVTLPVILGTPEEMFRGVGTYLAAGFTVNAPGLEEGEQREEIGWILRKVHERDGEETQVVALYSVNPALTWKVFHKYLNNEDEIAAFEAACGMRIIDLPVYPGGDYPERGKAASTDKFIIRTTKPFSVVMKSNPKHVPAPPEGQKDTRSATQKTTKLFVRWESVSGSGDGSAKPEVAKPQANGKTADDKLNEEVVWWKRYLDKDPSLDELTDNFHRWMKARHPKEIQEAVKEEAFGPWKATTGCWYDPDAKRWMPPKEADDPVAF